MTNDTILSITVIKEVGLNIPDISHVRTELKLTNDKQLLLPTDIYSLKSENTKKDIFFQFFGGIKSKFRQKYRFSILTFKY